MPDPDDNNNNNNNDDANNNSGDDGAKPKRPNGVPEDWIEKPGNKPGHTKWENPNNKHDYVRLKRDGTITQVRNGKAYDVNGNRVDLGSPDAHGITPDRFKFRP